MKTPPLALAVRAHHLCAATFRDGSPAALWAASHHFGSLEDLEEAATRLLLEVAPRIGGNLEVLLSVGPTYSRLKRVERVPTSVSDAELSAALGENRSRFFLGPAAHWSLLGWHRNEGQLWVGVVDPAVLKAIVAAANRVGASVRVCVPAVCAVAAVSPDGAREWSDGSRACAIAVRGGRVVRIQSLRRESADIDGTTALGMDDLLGVAEAVAVGAPARFPANDRRRTCRQRLVSSAVLAASVVLVGVAVMGPYLWHTARIRAATTARSLIADSVGRAIQAEASARAEREELQALSSFLTASDERRLALLAFIEALPDGAALATLRLDATGVTATVVAPESLDVLDAFARSPGLRDVAPVGGLSGEARDGVRFQRVVVRAGRRIGAEDLDEP